MRNTDGLPLRSAREITQNQTIRVSMNRGSLTAVVKEIEDD